MKTLIEDSYFFSSELGVPRLF